MGKIILQIIKYAIGIAALVIFDHFFDKFINSIEEKWHKKDGKSPAYHMMIVIAVLGITIVIFAVYMTHSLRTGQIPAELVVPFEDATRTIIGLYTILALFAGPLCFLLSQNKKDDKKK